MKILKFDARKMLRLRTEFALTREKLAEYLNINQTSIYKWEIGVNQPKLDYVKKISELLKIKPEELYIRVEEKSSLENLLDNLGNKVDEKKISEINELQNILKCQYDKPLNREFILTFINNIEVEILKLHNKDISQQQTLLEVLEIIKKYHP